MSRFREPSTWAGIATIVQALAFVVPPQWQWIAHTLTAAAGTAAVKLREGAP
ncbi:MAG: hypothetical protein ACOVPA_14565 [Rubrivivax sp.]|jgi:hypothetical protein